MDHFWGILRRFFRDGAVALAGLVFAFGCQSGPSRASGPGLGLPTTNEDPGQVEVELAGLLEVGERGSAQGASGFAFRKKLDLAKDQTGSIAPNSNLQEDFSPLDDTWVGPEGGEDAFTIEVTPLRFDNDSVFLQVEVVRIGKDGQRTSLSSPQLVAPYGQASEIRELNPGPEAEISRLRISVLPRPLVSPERAER